MKAVKIKLKPNLEENIQHGSHEFPIQYYVDELNHFENRSCPLHWHNAMEFFTVKSGTVEVQAGNSIYTILAGEGIFQNVNTLHGFRQVGPPEKCECPNIVFSDELIAPVNSVISNKYLKPISLSDDIPCAVLKRDIAWQREILEHLDLVFSLLQKYGPAGVYGAFPFLPFDHQEVESDCYEIQVQEELLTIWRILYNHRDEMRTDISIKDHRLQIRMQTMLLFIQNNYQNKLTLRDIADSANISKSECSRCFQNYLQSSPVDYLIVYRIERAKKLLQYGQDNIETIALSVGFESATYFCRMFMQKTGMTAKIYQEYIRSESKVIRS